MARELVYVAGPYRADTPQGIAWNTALAGAAGMALAEAGYTPIVPHYLSGMDWGNQLGDAWWLTATADLMLRCDKVAYLPRWHDSAGTRAELALAGEHGIECFPLEQLCEVPSAIAEWGDGR